MCIRDSTFGCEPQEQLVWVSKGCRGFFLCTGVTRKFSCGSHLSKRTNCTCDPSVRAAARVQQQAAGKARAELLRAQLWDTPSSKQNASAHRAAVRGAHCPPPTAPRAVRQQLLRTLYHDHDPFDGVIPKVHRADHRYPHSNLRAAFVRAALLSLGDARFWLEVGSFVGNSLILTASVAAELCYDALTIVACDSFLGDVGMWQYGKAQSGSARYDFLRVDGLGHPTIHTRFMANVVQSGAAPLTLPLPVPSLVGLRLLDRLHASAKSSLPRPGAIYLDASHEEKETLLELKVAWELLAPGGVLMGDDWGWGGVKHDVLAFTQLHDRTTGLASHAQTFLSYARDGGLNCTAMPRPTSVSLLLCDPGGTWAMFKGRD